MDDEKTCSIDSPQFEATPMTPEQVRRVAAQIRRQPDGLAGVISSWRATTVCDADNAAEFDQLNRLRASAINLATVLEAAADARRRLATVIEACVGKVPPQYVSAALEVLATGRLTD